MTRKLVSLAALFALALTTQSTQASPYVPVNPGYNPGQNLTILPHRKYAVIYKSPLRKRCFYGPSAHLRARILAARLRAYGAIVTVRCKHIRPLIYPPVAARKVCCVYFRMPTRVKRFHSYFAAVRFKNTVRALGFLAWIKPLPAFPPIPTPFPQPWPTY